MAETRSGSVYESPAQKADAPTYMLTSNNLN